MTPEQSKYFDDMAFLFGQQGWKNLIEDIQIRQTQEKENLLTKVHAQNDLAVLLGRNSVYEYILSLETVLTEIKRQLNEQTDSI